MCIRPKQCCKWRVCLWKVGEGPEKKNLQHRGKKPKTTITTTSLTAAIRQLKKAGTGAANKLISFTSRHTLGDMLLHSSETILQVKGLEREKGHSYGEVEWESKSKRGERRGEWGWLWSCVCRVSDAKCFDQSVQAQGQPWRHGSRQERRTGTGPTVAFCICHMSLPP